MHPALPRWIPSVLVALAVVATAAPLVLGGGVTTGGTQPVLTHQLIAPGDCTGCHGNYLPGPWLGSMMANAARDPLFWAALDVANDDLPGVGDFCLRCHVPVGWLEGRSEPGVDGCQLEGPIDGLDQDFEGVSCHVCHRMMVNPSPPPGESTFYTENAKYWIDDVNCSTPGSSTNGPCRRGPYGDYSTATPPGPAGPPPGNHPWAQSDYHRDAAICGTCHNVTNPVKTLIDETGTDTGLPYPIERTYAEWSQSAFADPLDPTPATCQGCHMPTPTSTAYACIFEENDRVGNAGRHEFVGANAWVPAVIKGEYGPTLGRDAELDATVAAALDMLQNRTAEVELEVASEITADASTLEASVRVTNLAGHKLPSGYTEGRRLWIELEVRDGNDEVVFESGAYDAASGVLTEDAQIKIYQSERGIWDSGAGECEILDGMGDHAFHFVLNDCILSDNRIPPRGFVPDLETEPVGYTYPEVAPGVLQHWDDTEYTIPLPPGVPGPLTVTARLRHQIASKEYVEFLRDRAVEQAFDDDCLTRKNMPLPVGMSRGEYLYEVWTMYDRSTPVDVAVLDEQVQLVIFADGFESGNTVAWSATVP